MGFGTLGLLVIFVPDMQQGIAKVLVEFSEKFVEIGVTGQVRTWRMRTQSRWSSPTSSLLGWLLGVGEGGLLVLADSDGVGTFDLLVIFVHAVMSSTWKLLVSVEAPNGVYHCDSKVMFATMPRPPLGYGRF